MDEPDLSMFNNEVIVEVDGVNLDESTQAAAEALISLVDGTGQTNNARESESQSTENKIINLDDDLSDAEQPFEKRFCSESEVDAEYNSSETDKIESMEEGDSSESSRYHSDTEQENQPEETSHSDEEERAQVCSVEGTKKRRQQKIQRLKKRGYGRELSHFNREHGLPYESVTYKQGEKITFKRPGRKMGPHCKSTQCRKATCCHLFTRNERTEIFTEFWKLSLSQKKVYLRSMVDTKPTKQPRNVLAKHRTKQNIYHLKCNGSRKSVCINFFLSTLGLKTRQMKNWLDPKRDRVDRPERQRPTPPEPTSSNKVKQFVTDVLQSLPRIPSHFCRASSEKEYLQTDFKSIRGVHRFVQDEAKTAGIGTVSWSTFHSIFTDLNLAVHELRKDACDTCTMLRIQMNNNNISQEEKAAVERELENHRNQYLRAKKEKDDDKKSGPQNLVSVCDLQKLFSLPQLTTNRQYYLSKLQVRNWSSYNLKNNDVDCYVWNECEGGVDSSDFSTLWCIHVSKEIERHPYTEELTMWSDSCFAQNKNIVLANALLHLAIQLQVIIVQKFFIRGHSFNENDSSHSCIERVFEKELMYCMEDVARAIRSARLHSAATRHTGQHHPYSVQLMEYTDFQSFKHVNYYSSLRPGIGVGSPTVNNIRALQYLPTGVINYKLDFEDDWQPLPNKCVNTTTEITSKYQARIPVSKLKYDHIKQLKSFIPVQYHTFFDELPVQE